MLESWRHPTFPRLLRLSPLLAPVGYGTGGPMFLGDHEVHHRTWAEETQRAIDLEVARILREAEERAIGLLQANRGELDALTELLLAHETVNGERVYELVGRPMPGGGQQLQRGQRHPVAEPVPVGH